MEKKLAFKYPMITSWTWISTTFAILENYSNSYSWLYNNFIQLFCEIYDERISVHYIPHVDVFSISPFFHTMLIPRDLVKEFNDDIVEFFKICLKNNFYVYCIVNETKFLNKKFKLLHELTIWGYDDKEKFFDIADFTLSGTGKYSFGKISFEELRNAYYQVSKEEDDLPDGMGGYGGILIFSVNEKYKHKLDMELVISYLEDYLSGKDSGKKYRTYRSIERELKGLKQNVYGINIYKEMANYYSSIGERGKAFQIQPLHVLCDHNKLMINRLYYFRDKLSINIPNNIIDNFQELMREKLILRSRGIKYLVTKDRKCLESFSPKIEAIFCREKECIKELINILQYN